MEQQFKEVAVKFVNDMCSGNYDECYTVMDETMKKSMSADDLKKDWETLKSVTGPIESASVTNTAESNGFYIVVITCRGEVQDLIVQVVMNEDRTVTGLWSVLSPKVEPAEVSYEGVVEEDMVINAGTEWELNGKLTLPASQEGPFPAAILIHGSGPSDMNETVGGCAPFRDLAVGLARQGIAVLRYDKRTFAHAQQLSQGNVAELTTKEEYIDDVVAAVTLLKSDSRIDS
ncbi:alpha/beta hydrolase, partial [Methanomethylophilus alvi]|uniref:alpha/beta hydrolase n=1 Tax=Methanomethylophilus alvi TaxID=1291540 RepID=UPI0037DC198E